MKKGKEQILEFMRRSSYAPLTAEDLIEEIPITGNLNNFWQDLKELQENGEIIKTRFGTFGLPERMGLVVGRFQLTSKGFGFVIPDNKGERPDVFIPPRLLNGAMNNDRVMARVEKGGGNKNKPEGEIIRIITHANNKIVGTFKASRDYGFVVPDDKRIGQDVYVLKRNFGEAKKQPEGCCGNYGVGSGQPPQYRRQNCGSAWQYRRCRHGTFVADKAV